MIWFVGVAAASASFSYCFPYLLSGLDFLGQFSEKRSKSMPVHLPSLAAIEFIVITAISYFLLIVKKEKG